jgi:hypothetical protein
VTSRCEGNSKWEGGIIDNGVFSCRSLIFCRRLYIPSQQDPEYLVDIIKQLTLSQIIQGMAIIIIIIILQIFLILLSQHVATNLLNSING